jgi:iron complex transport system ATP-binding protein
MPEQGIAVRAERVCVQLAGRPVLREVELQAKPGEVVALLGPNGAGKSTLLKAIAGLLPYDGSIRLGHDELVSLRTQERAKRVAYVPQRSLLRSALSVDEVVALGRYVHAGALGGRSARDQDAIDRALRTAHADMLRNRIFTQLSVGEQQRVLIARALASEAPILLLDEPTAALDVGEGLAVLQLIRKLRARGHSLIIVLHDLADARSSTDRAYLLEAGRIVKAGPTPDVISPKPIRDVYGVRMIENARIGFEMDSPEGDAGP